MDLAEKYVRELKNVADRWAPGLPDALADGRAHSATDEAGRRHNRNVSLTRAPQG